MPGGLPDMLSVNRMVVVSGRMNQSSGGRKPGSELIVEEVIP